MKRHNLIITVNIEETLLEKDTSQKSEILELRVLCQACPPGKFSEKLNDNKGETYICVPCSKGTSQSSGASDSCTPCKEGRC